MPARDRRAGIERTIELSRWMVLIFAAVANNFPGLATGQSTAAVNLVLGAWGVFNLAATVMLLAHRIPGRRLQVATIVLDLAVASGLVYLTGGYNSDLAVTFFIVVIASSLRFGLVGSMACAFVAGVAYFVVGFEVANHTSTRPWSMRWCRGSSSSSWWRLSSNLLARELVGERDAQVRRSIELEHAAFAELREVDRIKSEFMMLASHELRTPLTKIKAWLTLMHDAGDRLPQDARDEGLHELRLEAEHLARLTDNLLCIAQLESGEIRLKTAAVDLENVFREVIARFVESADHDRFAITVAPTPSACSRTTNVSHWSIACLIDNALKFSPNSEPVRVTTYRAVNKVHVEVRDNGRRIPDSDVDRVFASFYQVESPLLRQRGGFGVGLYLARQLVERMGGRIWIDNSRARGNTFVVALPVHV